MTRAGRIAVDWALRLAGVVAALVLSALVLLVLGVSPFRVAGIILSAAFGSTSGVSGVLALWVPLLLCAAGLLLTFSAGMWNIGIEGQIAMGAVLATGTMLLLRDVLPPAAVLCFAALGGMLGGALWALLVGLLRLYGNVNEIFGGLGLNFLADGLILYLVKGPWGQPGRSATSGMEPFPPALWLPSFPPWQIGPWQVPALNVSPIELLLGLAALVLVALALRGTHFGLRLKAVGKNLRSAFLLGVSTTRHLLMSFVLCGAMAGLAGWVLVVGPNTRHQLLPQISSGLGFLAILVVLLVNLNAWWSLPVTFFFAAIAKGSSLRPTMELGLDSAVGGVIQGLLVLSILIAQGLQNRFLRREGG